MNIQETSAEKRNLMLISILIIVFVLGGGVFDSESQIKLSVISVKFENIKTLIFLIYCFLFYFSYRYYVTSHKKHKKMLHDELVDILCHNDFKICIEKYLSQAIENSGLSSASWDRVPEKMKYYFTYISRKEKKNNAGNDNTNIPYMHGLDFYPKTIFDYVIIIGWYPDSRNYPAWGASANWDRDVKNLEISLSQDEKNKVLLKLIREYPSISDYYIPYALLFLALILFTCRIICIF